MKKYISGIIVLLFILAAVPNINAQNSASLGFTYGFDMEEVGIQIGGMHALNEKMSVGGDLVYYLIGDEEFAGFKFSTNAFEVNANFRYTFLEQDDLHVYGLGTLGLHIVKVKVSYGGDSSSDSDSEVGLGLGGGAQYNVGNLGIFAEPRLFLSGFDQFQFTAGIRVNI